MNRREFVAGLSLPLFGCGAHADPTEPWPEGAVSLSYDDGLPSHLDVAAPALTRHGLRGTFFVTWTNIAPRVQDWIAVGRAGHEVADHTVHHRCDLQDIRASDYFEREIEPMEAWLDRTFGPRRDRDFAYPCDVTDIGSGSATVQMLRFEHRLRRIGLHSARTSEGEPNAPQWARRHPYKLQALAVGYDTRSPDDVFRYLDRARARRHWAILVMHDITDTPADGTMTIRDHDLLLDHIAKSGMLCRPIGRVLAGLARAKAAG